MKRSESWKMMSRKSYMAFVLLVVGFIVPVCIGQTDKVLSGRELLRAKRKTEAGESMLPKSSEGSRTKVKEVLIKFAENQEKYGNCYLKAESSSEVTSKGRRRRIKYQTISELFYDRDRSNLRGRRWGEMDSSGNFRTRENADYVRTLNNVGGLRHYMQSTPSPSVKTPNRYTIVPTMSKEESTRHVKQSVSRGWDGHEAMGYFEDDERVDIHLQEAEDIQLKDTKEKVNGVDCYFIEAVSKNVKYKLWIDPEHNYNITKAIVLKMPNSFMGSSRLVGGEEIQIELNVISHKKVDGAWVVSEADIVRRVRIKEYKFVEKRHFKLLDVQFNPDFDKLEAFSESDVQNGTSVSVAGADGIEYTWHDGRIVDPQGREVDVGATKPKEPVSLVGKQLPSLVQLGAELDPTKLEGKRILVCFWDMNQRRSRFMVRALGKRAEKLKEKGVEVVCVQASKVGKAKLYEWLKKNEVSLLVGMVEGDEEKVKSSWGVKSLPWLILADEKHVVQAEGLSLAEVDERFKIEMTADKGRRRGRGHS